MTGTRDDDPLLPNEYLARLAEADALEEAPPAAPDDAAAEVPSDPGSLAAFESLRSWDIWLSDMLRARRRLLDTVILTFAPGAASLAVMMHHAARWSGNYRGAAAHAAERGSGAASTVEFDNFALDVAVQDGSLAVTLFSTAFDVGGIAFSVRGADGSAVSRGETDMLGRLQLAVPADAPFDLVLERHSGEAA